MKELNIDIQIVLVNAFYIFKNVSMKYLSIRKSTKTILVKKTKSLFIRSFFILKKSIRYFFHIKLYPGQWSFTSKHRRHSPCLQRAYSLGQTKVITMEYGVYDISCSKRRGKT